MPEDIMIKIIHSRISSDGIENIIICIGDGCHIDERGVCRGDYICFSNNHKKQTCTISKGTHSQMSYKPIETIKDEVWIEGESLKYLQGKGIPINQEVVCLKKEEQNANL